MSETREHGAGICGACNGMGVVAHPLPTPDAPQVTFPDGCAADPIKTFEGYPGIQVDAPQVERFKEIRARTEKATAGPWRDCADRNDRKVSKGLHEFHSWVERDATEQVICVIGYLGENDRESWAERKRDAEFIAHAREDIPYLLDQIASLLAEKARLEGELIALRDAVRKSNAAEDAFVDIAFAEGGESVTLVAAEEACTEAKAKLRALVDPPPLDTKPSID